MKNLIAEPQQLHYDDLILDTGLLRAYRNGREIKLTIQEYRLLYLFMTHSDMMMTRNKISEIGWGRELDFNSNIIEVYVRYLRVKLGLPRLIQTLRGYGYMLHKDGME
jgi:DNA-binding response OmpR family regulator